MERSWIDTVVLLGVHINIAVIMTLFALNWLITNPIGSYRAVLERRRIGQARTPALPQPSPAA